MGAHHHSTVGGHQSADTQRTALRASIAANSVLLAVQVAVGLTIGSLALLADSLHNASDVIALGVALAGAALARRPATVRASYGLVRAEILAAFINAVVLVVLTLWVGVSALGRIANPTELPAGPLIAIGVLGLVVNGLSALWIHRAGGANLNMRAAFWHLTADAAGSFGVACAGVGVFFFDAFWVDPVMSLVISVLVLAGVTRLLVDTVGVLLETTPRGLDPTEVTAALVDQQGVCSVHHLHIWSVSSDEASLTAHLVMDDGVDLHEAQHVMSQARVMLEDRFGVSHVTLEPECHDCDTPTH